VVTPPQIRLISFCGTLTAEELNRPLPGFGFPTVLRQLAHTIGAEVYWQTVVTRGYSEEARMPALPDVAAIEAFREQTASVTRSYLEGASEAELNTPRAHLQSPGAGAGDVPRYGETERRDRPGLSGRLS
jgi:uncharacterized damage-inducible protein DinB